MSSRRVVPAKPEGTKASRPPSSLAPVTPLFASLTSPTQLIENTAVLSPLFATLTKSAAATLLFAALTKKHRGVALPLTSIRTQRALPTPVLMSDSPLGTHVGAPTTPIASCTSALFPVATDRGVPATPLQLRRYLLTLLNASPYTFSSIFYEEPCT